MIYFPRAVGNPRELPELRAALLSLAAPKGLWHSAEIEKLVMDIAGGPKEVIRGEHDLTIVSPEGLTESEMRRRLTMAVEQADNTVRWYREKLPAAQMIHVTPEMTDFIVAAAEAVPDDLRLSLEDAPSPSGLVVFAKPVIGTDAGPEFPGGEVRVDAVMWGEALLPPRDVKWYDERSKDLRVPSATIGMFRMLAPEHTDTLALRMEMDTVVWLPLGRTDWPWGDRLDEQPAEHLPNANPTQWASMMEDRRLLAALWAVINQKRLIDTWDVWPTPHARKRLEKMGQGGRDERVRIVHLRRSEYRGVERVEGTGRHVSVRFPVRPFYRRQPYGPNRSLRRIVLIPAHWRGPDGAPIVHAERIWEVDR